MAGKNATYSGVVCRISWNSISIPLIEKVAEIVTRQYGS
jgi:hypothetical protein